jgi:hypothetical protein
VAAGLVEHKRPAVDEAGNRSESYVADAPAEVSDSDRMWLMLTRAWAAGRADSTAARDAIRCARRLGQPYAVARGCLIAGELGIEPVSMLREALELFAGLGAVPSWCRAAAAARAQRISFPMPAVGPDGYDDVTRVLLALVAEGLPTRVIAQALHVGHTALEMRLSRLYARSGYRSRAELAAAFREGELTAAWL